MDARFADNPDDSRTSTPRLIPALGHVDHKLRY
jgi:hypothetical protein